MQRRASYITGQVLAVDGGFDAAGIGLPTLRGERRNRMIARRIGHEHLRSCPSMPLRISLSVYGLASAESLMQRVIFARPAARSLAARRRAAAEVRILASPGGEVGPFLDLFARVRASGERVVIDGPCLSACTLVLSAVPNERICVTRRAVLGFHAARSMDARGRLYAEPEARRRCCRPIRRRCETGSAAAAG